MKRDPKTRQDARRYACAWMHAHNRREAWKPDPAAECERLICGALAHARQTGMALLVDDLTDALEWVDGAMKDDATAREATSQQLHDALLGLHRLGWDTGDPNDLNDLADWLADPDTEGFLLDRADDVTSWDNKHSWSNYE